MSNISTSPNQIQVESVQYQAPVSESALSSIGAAVNYSLLNAPPLGTIIPIAMSQAQVDSLLGVGYYLLANGQSCVGTRYASVTGSTTTPDVSLLYLPLGPWLDFSGTGNVTSGVTYASKYRRVGDSAEVIAGWTVTDQSSLTLVGQIRLSTPAGVFIDTSKFPNRPTIIGEVRFRCGSVPFGFPAVDRVGFVEWDGSNVDVGLKWGGLSADPSSLQVLGNNFNPLQFLNGNYIQARFTVPIQGFGLPVNYFIRVN
jgi:hypothetical protein